MPNPSHPVTAFQRAMIETYRQGQYAHLGALDDQKKLLAALRKDPGSALLAVLVEQSAGLDDPSDVGTLLMSAEADVREAMAAVGAVATARHGLGR